MKYLLAVKTIFINDKRFFMDVISYTRGSFYVILREKIEDVKRHVPIDTSFKNIYIKLKDEKEIKRIYGDKMLDPSHIRKNNIFRNTDKEFDYLPTYYMWGAEEIGLTGSMDVCIPVEIEEGTRKNHDISYLYTIVDGDEYIYTPSFLFGRGKANSQSIYSKKHGNIICLSYDLGEIGHDITYTVRALDETDDIIKSYKRKMTGTRSDMYIELDMHVDKENTIDDMYSYIFCKFNGKYKITKLILNKNNNTICVGLLYNGTRERELGYKFFKIKKYGEIINSVSELDTL